MKIWRKLAILLGLTFAFSFTACEMPFGDKDSSEDSSSSIGDSGSTITPDVDVDNVETYNFNISVKIADEENGGDYQISITAPEITELGGEAAMAVAMLENIYVVDGFTYIKQGETWMQSDVSIWALLEQSGIPAEDAKTEITNLFAELKELEIPTTSIKYSYANEVNATLDYIGALSKQTTLMTVVDDALGFVDTSFAEIKTYIIEQEVGSMTVGEMHTAINGYLAENTEYADIDAVVEYVLSMEEVAPLVEEISGGAMTAADIIAMDVDEMLVEYHTMTVDDLINMAIMLISSSQGEQGGAAPLPEIEGGVETVSATLEEDNANSESAMQEITLEGLVEMAEGYLNTTTLGDLIPDDEVWMAVMMCNALNVTKCDIVLATESVFKELKSASVDFAFAVEMLGAEKVTYELNVALDVAFVETIAAPTNAYRTCYACGANSVETTVLPRENGYVLCNACNETFDWEYCEYCGELKEDAVWREDEDDAGYWCDECAPKMAIIPCAYCENREEGIGTAWREKAGEYLCDQDYAANFLPQCDGCYENKADVTQRDDIGGAYCDECYAEKQESAK